MRAGSRKRTSIWRRRQTGSAERGVAVSFWDEAASRPGLFRFGHVEPEPNAKEAVRSPAALRKRVVNVARGLLGDPSELVARLAPNPQVCKSLCTSARVVVRSAAYDRAWGWEQCGRLR